MCKRTVFFRKILICLMLTFVLLTLSVYAIDLEFIPEQKKDVNANMPQAVDFVSEKTEGVKTIRKIAVDDFERCQQALRTEGYSKSEMNREILLALGYTENEIDSIPQEEIDLIMSEALEITTTESYVKIDENNIAIEISDEECMTAVQQAKGINQDESMTNIGTLSVSSNGNDGEMDENVRGWMRIITTATYIRPNGSGEKGWYYISGNFSWLSMPINRMTDAMSLFASNCTWSQNNNDYYSIFTHKYMNYLGLIKTSTEKKTTQDREVSENGVYYTWKLPKSISDFANSNVYSVCEMNFYVRGKCQVSNYTSSNSFNVFSRYEHVRSAIGVQPSFGWTLGSVPGVSAKVDWRNEVDSYTSLCYVDYRPNRDLYGINR